MKSMQKNNAGANCRFIILITAKTILNFFYLKKIFFKELNLFFLKTIRLTTALKPLLPFVFPALNQSALAVTTSQHPPLVLFIDNKCDSRWDVRPGNDGQPLILKSTMYLCLLNSSILDLLVVNLLLYSILSFLLNLTLLL